MKKWMVAAIAVTLAGGAFAHCGFCPGDKKAEEKPVTCSAQTNACTAAKKAACTKADSEKCAAKKAACSTEGCKEKKAACPTTAAAKTCCPSSTAE